MPVLGLKDPGEDLPDDFDQKAVAALKKRVDIIFVISIISIVFCWITGAVATYLAYQAQKDVAAGNISSAEQQIKMATAFMIVSFIGLGLSLLINIWLRIF